MTIALSKPEQVVLELERRILSGELQAGDRLPTEEELGARLGVSRTVVRDAIRTLATRQLIRVRHGFGMEVAHASDLPVAHAVADLLMRADVTVGDVLEARAALDGQLAPLAAAAATDADVARMERQLDRLALAVEGGDDRTAHDAHLEFHLGFVQAMHLPALELLLKPLAEVILLSSVRPAPVPERWEVESHRPMLAALRARDAGALVAAVAHHYDVLSGGDYGAFRASRFCDLLAHQELLTLRSLLSARAAAPAEEDR